jgi:hypothetical protein
MLLSIYKKMIQEEENFGYTIMEELGLFGFSQAYIL